MYTFKTITLTWLSCIFIFVILLIIIYFYLTKNFDYFKKRGITYLKPYPFVGSGYKVLLQYENNFDYILTLYKLAKKKGFCGTFHYSNPVYILGTPELVKLVCVKDFDHFTDHNAFSNAGILENNLFSAKGQHWKRMRAKISPAFTSSKLRYLFDFVEVCGKQIDVYIMKEFQKQKLSNCTDIIIKKEMKDLFGRYTNDAYTSTLFGIEVDSLSEPENELYIKGKDLTDFTSGLRWIKGLLAIYNPFLFKLIYRCQLFDPKTYKFFEMMIKGNMKKRRNENIVRRDLINLLMEIQENDMKTGSKDFTDDNIVAQLTLLTLAGFDTVASSLCLIAHDLAANQECQEKLLKEIDSKFAEHNGVIPYDCLIKEMPYLDMVINESQRLHPTAPFIERLCNKAYHLPADGDRPAFNLKPGDQLWIPIYGFHHDSQFFPNAHEFIPERWQDNSQYDTSIFMPFGIGPRICLATRFALMELKLGIVYLLKNCRLIFIDETEHPLRLIQGLSLINKNGFWLGIQPRH